MIEGGGFLIQTPEQLRAVADPIRQRLLQAFAEPLPVRDAAALLGEPVTKLYHHIDQLLAAGLIRVTRTERKRAVVERHFQAVASRFAVAQSAFGGPLEIVGQRAAIARANLEEILAGVAPEEGAFRLARSSARLDTAALECFEAEIERLLRHLDDPAAPRVDLLYLSTRRKD